ncbi:MAG TPA: lipid-A-disaccharide synthase [Melioribacteraceae bacterium]|nr:lipid-A-disaccharide synthase [Melioribacteraceae bacterium]
MIIAGEASGDMHGASLIHELKKLDPELKISGIGGDRMIAEGMQPLFHIKRMAFLGFIEVLRHLPFIRKVQTEILKKIKQESIDTVVLIDYPGFNLEMAGKLKQPGKKIIYYISPQVWAWGIGRIKKIKELIDKMIVVFPFEEKLYKENGVDAVYVGHPLIEQINSYQFLSKEELFEKLKLEEGKEILLLMPGSRKHEIKKLFPVSIKAAKHLADEFNLQIVVACAENIDEHVFNGLSEIKDFKLVKGNRYDLLKYSKFGIIKSGTSTLEAGIFELPFVVVYSTNALTYHLGKMLVKINNIAMANIILGETVVTELIQKEVNVEKIYEVSKEILSDNSRYETIRTKLGSIKSRLGSIGASKRAAELIFSKLNEA